MTGKGCLSTAGTSSVYCMLWYPDKRTKIPSRELEWLFKIVPILREVTAHSGSPDSSF